MPQQAPIVYLDNAATSFPKPSQVLRRMLEDYASLGVSPGRGSHDLSRRAEDYVSLARQRLCGLFGGDAPERVIFAYNATEALNLLIQGLLGPGDQVLSTRLEHNSVLRPLHHLRQAGVISLDLAPFDSQGLIDPAWFARAIGPRTRLVIVNHASNVLGVVQPVAAIGQVCRQRGVPLVLDVSQSAGLAPIDMTAWGVAALAFTGHKALQGPTGIGGAVISRDLEVRPSRFGGTGLDSHSLVHPRDYPHRLEAGTINILGVMGLMAGLDYLEGQGWERVRQREMVLWQRLRDGLAGLPGLTLYAAQDGPERVPVLSCNLAGMDPADLGQILDGDYGIAVRGGLHCAPLLHQDLGTGRAGALRFSLGPLNSQDDVDQALAAMTAIAHAKSSSK
ncbi:MAG: aminotransferase class V-fold PLP-dependent enzyme [Pseudomonadota bacterium]